VSIPGGFIVLVIFGKEHENHRAGVTAGTLHDRKIAPRGVGREIALRVEQHLVGLGHEGDAVSMAQRPYVDAQRFAGRQPDDPPVRRRQADFLVGLHDDGKGAMFVERERWVRSFRRRSGAGARQEQEQSPEDEAVTHRTIARLSKPTSARQFRRRSSRAALPWVGAVSYLPGDHFPTPRRAIVAGAKVVRRMGRRYDTGVREERWRVVSMCAACVVFGGCARASMPDPRDTIRAYRTAAAKGDARAIYAMLSEPSRKSLQLADVERILADERAELSAQAAAADDRTSVVRASARVRYADGEDATLDLEEGSFRVSSSDALPAGARTPSEALEQLRRVLARRSYAGLMRVLSPATRSALESDLRSLVDGLAHPDGLDVQVSGDVASVQIQGGHFVKLRRDGGVWKVEDFD